MLISIKNWLVKYFMIPTRDDDEKLVFLKHWKYHPKEMFPTWPSGSDGRVAAPESDAGAGGESPVRAPVRAATLCPYA